jgi:ABC-type glycerol-3-phosphate transport system substrate-binding protein
MRKWLLLVVVLALVLGAMGVSAQDDLSSVDPSGQTIQYWNQYGSGAQLDTMTALIEDFNANNEWGITVEASSPGSYPEIRTAVSNGIVSGELPNLAAGFNNDALSWALDDAVVDLEPYFSDPKWGFTDEEKADLNLEVLNLFVTADGKRLGWVNQVSAEVLAVNLGMLKELGFDGAPATLDQFKEIACAASKSGKTGAAGATVQGYPIVADSSQFESFVAGIGGSIWKDDKWDFTNAESVQVLQFLQDLYKEGCAYIPSANFGNTADFALGTNPMAQTSTAGIPFIMGDISNAEKGNGIVTDWTVTTTPPVKEGDKPVLQLFSPGLIMIEGTPEQNLATWLFIKYLAAPENQAKWTQATSYFPISKAASEQLGEMNPFFTKINEGLANGDYTIYLSPQQLSYGQVRGIVATGIADVTSGDMDVATVAQRITDESNAALESG